MWCRKSDKLLSIVSSSLEICVPMDFSTAVVCANRCNLTDNASCILFCHSWINIFSLRIFQCNQMKVFSKSWIATGGTATAWFPLGNCDRPLCTRTGGSGPEAHITSLVHDKGCVFVGAEVSSTEAVEKRIFRKLLHGMPLSPGKCQLGSENKFQGRWICNPSKIKERCATEQSCAA